MTRMKQKSRAEIIPSTVWGTVQQYGDLVNETDVWLTINRPKSTNPIIIMHLSHNPHHTTLEQKCAPFCTKVVHLGVWVICVVGFLFQALVLRCGIIYHPSHQQYSAWCFQIMINKVQIILIPFLPKHDAPFRILFPVPLLTVICVFPCPKVIRITEFYFD